MAKTFKRTLIATLSVLCLLALSLFAAACSPAANAYKVTLDYESEKGEVTLDPVQDTYDAGSDVTVTVTPKPNYEVGTFKVDGKDEQLTNGKYTFAVEKDTVVAVTFTQKITTEDNYLITVTPTQNGTVVLSDPGPVASGTEITATVTPAPGYELDTAKVNGADVTVDGNNRFKFTVTADTTVTVTFKEVPVTKYNVSAAAAQNGTVSLDHEGEVAVNTEVTVTIAPATGYELDTAKVNDDDVTSSVVDNQFKFTVEGDTVVTVTFKETTPPAPTTYNVSAASTTHGSVTLDHEGEVAVNTEVTVTITPDGGYELDTAKVNTTDVTSSVVDNQFKFTVEGDTVVTVTFKETVPPTPPLDIEEKWWGTFIGTKEEDDSEWKIVIDATSLTLYINDVDQHVSVTFEPKDPDDFSSVDAYVFTLGEHTIYVEKGYEDDDLGIYEITAYAYGEGDEYYPAYYVDLTDAKKIPPVPPKGDPIEDIPNDFIGVWYGADYDDVLYTLDIKSTEITITIGDGDPIEVDVTDILYNSHEEDWGSPTLYFTCDGNEAELSYNDFYGDDPYLSLKYGKTDIYNITHEKPYGDASDFLASIVGTWAPEGTDQTWITVSGTSISSFYVKGQKLSVSSRGMERDAAEATYVFEVSDTKYSITKGEYDIYLTGGDFSHTTFEKTAPSESLPAEYHGVWYKIDAKDEAMITVAADGTVVYTLNPGDEYESEVDYTVFGLKNMWLVNGYQINLEPNTDNNVFCYYASGHLTYFYKSTAKETVPADLANTTWVGSDDTVVSFTDSSIDIDDSTYHIYYVKESGDAYTFVAYRTNQKVEFTYYDYGMLLSGETSYTKQGGGTGDLTDLAGTYKTTDSSHTVVIGDDGSVTIDDTPADSISEAQGYYMITAGENEYTLLFGDYVYDGVYFAFLYDLNSENGVVLIPDGTEAVTVDPALEGTWNGSTDDWLVFNGSDYTSASGMLDDIKVVIGADGSVKMDGTNMFVFSGYGSVEEGVYMYMTASVNTMLFIQYGPDDPTSLMVIVCSEDSQGASYMNTLSNGEVTPPTPGTAIDESLYGVWRGNNGGDSYVVTIDAEGVHFARNSGTSVDGTVHDIAADGLSFDVDVLFPGNSSPYNFHAVYSASTGNLTLTDSSVYPPTTIVLTKDSADMETIPDIYQGKWDIVNEGKIVGKLDITTNTIALTLDGQSHAAVHIGLDDVNNTTVTFRVDGEEYQLRVNILDFDTFEQTYQLGKGADTIVGTLYKEGTFKGYTVPESVKGNYHTEDNNVTVTVGDTITATIGGKEVTLDIVGLDESSTSVRIYVTSADGGKGSFGFDFGDGADIPASYSFTWAADGHSAAPPYELIKDGEEEVPAHALAGNYTVQAGNPLSTKNTVAFAITADGTMTLTTSIKTENVNLTESEGSYTCTINRSPYTVEFTDTFGNDVLVISGKGGTFYAIRDGVGPAVELNLLLGTWRTADGMHTVDVSADGITYDDVAVYVYGYYKDGDGPNTGYKFISGNTPYNFYSNDGTTATFYNCEKPSSTTFTKDGGSGGDSGGGGGGGEVGDDGVYTFSGKTLPDYLVGTFTGSFTGSDKTSRNWTITTTANSIKVEVDGVVQTLDSASIVSYGDGGLEFKIPALGTMKFAFQTWGGDHNDVVIQDQTDSSVGHLTKA